MNAPATLYIPRDSVALALGADALAGAAVQAGAKVVRTGSRGLFWLEPLVEMADADGERIGFGGLQPEDMAALCTQGAGHARCLGKVAALPYLARQNRLCFARMGLCDPVDVADYAAHGGYAGLRAALAAGPAATVQTVLDSGLRGRGGAAFPAGIKWRTVAQAQAKQKYIVCNADEGDSGTFADRMVLEGDPLMLIEGMTIAGMACGATQGYVYIRSEYQNAIKIFQEALGAAYAAAKLGANIAGSGHSFDLQLRKAAGAYVCGEETALLESIEGKRGIVRSKPPLPALQGLFGQPTVIHNVITLASVPAILQMGAAHYAALGKGRSCGTLPIQLAGNIRYGGLVELPFGVVTLRQLVFDFGGGTRSGKPVKAIQVGGPLGPYVPQSAWDVPWDYESYAAHGIAIGHGGIVVHDSDANMAALARYAMQFCVQESCGKCTPCRIGSTRGVEVLDRLVQDAEQGAAAERQLALLHDLCDTMMNGSLCAMGSMTPLPVLSALKYYSADFGAAAVRARG